jgi:excisionase family DNA binding protein
MEKEKEVLGLPDIARLLGINYRTALRLVQTGELPVAKLGGHYYALRADILRWISETAREEAAARASGES